MATVKDLSWKKGINVSELVNGYAQCGFQSIELAKATDIIVKMKKEGIKVYFTFTSNMVTSGLRGFFAQLVKLKLVDVIVTTVGGIEEDIMKAHGEKFSIGKFSPDDWQLHEQGVNRVGNIFIRNESYQKFEDVLNEMLKKLSATKMRWATSDMLKEIGGFLDDENSILYQANKNNVPIFCPAITDGAFGFHLFMHQEKNKDFVIDPVADFKNILFTSSHDDKKGLISLGGSISKHHAILAGLLNGGMDYAVYMTTSRSTSGSMSGATTEEAKSWGKVKDDSDVATVNGDVAIIFPLAMMAALDRLAAEGIIKEH